MSAYAIFGLIFAAWTMLSLVGSERQRELVTVRRKVAEELENAEPPAAAPNPTAPPNSTKVR